VYGNRKPAAPVTLQRLLAPIRILGEPQPGHFKMRLVKRGPWVPALIWRPCPLILPDPLELTPAPEDWCLPTERPRMLRARIGTTEADPFEVWTNGQRITAREYHWRLDLARYATDHAPLDPEADPRRRVDLSRAPSLF